MVWYYNSMLGYIPDPKRSATTTKVWKERDSEIRKKRDATRAK